MRFVTAKEALEANLELLNRLAEQDLKKPCVTGVVLSGLVLNQLIIADHCIAILSEKNYSTFYFSDKHSLQDLVVVYKFNNTGKDLVSPVDLSLVCDKLYMSFDKNNDFYIVMRMNNAFFEIYETLNEEHSDERY